MTNRPTLSDKNIRILDAAAEAFMTLGFDAASIDHIADLMGVTKGGVYYYYRSKMDLFFAVHRRAMEANLDRLRPLAEDETRAPDDRLFDMVRAHALLMMEQTSYQRVTVQGVDLYQTAKTSLAERQQLDELVAMRDEYESLFTETVSAGSKVGVLRDVDARLATRTLLGSLNWITMWYRPRPADTDTSREQTAHEIAQQLLFGLTTSGPTGEANPR
ncbi:transcriptional regulator, TetR family [Pseudonocardia ammonioxydans]|uniref:Transcriptional regulator, TetR family n=1 Tax=Pseudonocardia ammonioxydans TaxID=260086 RepID=A0A1I5HM81_PSUAM|nr:TetR/AcrR family transcriptional regulator [Pseudonocardia ammonioxydans]SFO49404.1 transcriptional regulator, TetR family [Pseudonocardia ammonioxydans]